MATKTAPRSKPASAPAGNEPTNPKGIKFESIDADDVELAGRNRSSKFQDLKAALESAKVGQSFITEAEGEDDDGKAQYRITLYAYMSRFGLLVSCKPTKDGRILVTKRDPATKRIVVRKPRAKKAS